MKNILPFPTPNLYTAPRQPGQKPGLAWFTDRLFLTDPQRRKLLCEFEIRTHHNGRELPSPEIALPEVNESLAGGDKGGA